MGLRELIMNGKQEIRTRQRDNKLLSIVSTFPATRCKMLRAIGGLKIRIAEGMPVANSCRIRDVQHYKNPSVKVQNCMFFYYTLKPKSQSSVSELVSTYCKK